MDIFDYYKNLIKSSKKWVLYVFGLFLVGAVVGFVYFSLDPKLIETIVAQFKDIIPLEGTSTNGLVGLIFKQNMTAAMLALFGGLILGIIPVAITAMNGFIVGYIVRYIFTISEQGFFSTLIVFLVSILPHGIFELPIIFFAAALGIWWGMGGIFSRFKFGSFDSSFKSRSLICLSAIPLIAVVLLLAAYIEVYVSLALVSV